MFGCLDGNSSDVTLAFENAQVIQPFSSEETDKKKKMIHHDDDDDDDDDIR